MKRNLEEILLEARRVTIKDEKEVMDCINRLGGRSMGSLLEGVEKDLECFGDFRSSLTFRILHGYVKISELSYSQKKHALMNITFKEYISLMRSGLWYKNNGFVRDKMIEVLDFMFILLRIRGDKDVGDFMRIDFRVFEEMCSKKNIELPSVDFGDMPSVMLLDYIDKRRNLLECRFFELCDDYDVDKAKEHFLEQAHFM